jgi:hypothetical protein
MKMKNSPKGEFFFVLRLNLDFNTPNRDKPNRKYKIGNFKSELVLIAMAAVATLAAAVATTVTEAALRAVFERTGFLDYQGAAAELAVVKGVHGSVSFGVVIKFDETETAAAAGHFVRNYCSRSDGAMGTEQLL